MTRNEKAIGVIAALALTWWLWPSSAGAAVTPASAPLTSTTQGGGANPATGQLTPAQMYGQPTVITGGGASW